MVSFPELKSRIKKYFRFSKQETIGLVVAVLITGFIFSFQNWGDTRFDPSTGLANFLLITIAAAFVFFFGIALQKIYALSIGHKAEFNTWFVGLAIALVICFLTGGHLTLILAGGMHIAFMTRHRLGEFRYGQNIEEKAITSFWGVLGNVISAGIFAIFLYFLPNVLFFEKGLMISLIFAICSLFPLPSLSGLSIFFGSRGLYLMSVVMAVAVYLLLVLGGGLGLLIALIIGAIIGGYYLLAVSSEI